MRKGSIVQLAALGAVLGACAGAVAYFVPWLPTSAAAERGRIDFAFWFVTVICIVIFAVVGSVLIYSIVHFRVRPDDDTDGPPIHGHTGVEVVWTAVPAVLVTAISIVSGVVLHQNGRVPANHLTVEVTAQQFAWSFKYPDASDLTTGQLRLPIGKAVELKITSIDVIHSFWVPEFGQKQDAVPGSINKIVITPNRLGTYPVVCTELCGLGHSVMRTSAIVMPQKGFDAWLKGQRHAISGGGGSAGKAVYANNGCGGCHTLTAAGTSGKLGPDLDKLPAEAQKAGRPLEAFVRDSIVNPDDYVEPGYLKRVMPSTFAQLPKDQLDALVQYLISSSKGK